MEDVFGKERELLLTMLGTVEKSRKKKLATAIVKRIPEIVKAVPCIEGLHTPPGYMLENGGRAYLDGEMLEVATPEVTDPLEALVYAAANERILWTALQRAARSLAFHPEFVRLVRRCSDGAGHYLGTHISVMTRRWGAVALVEHMVPFLTTRFYACSGSFGPDGFTMSHKHAAVRTVAGQDSRENRPIVHLKQEDLAGPGFHRVHVTHGDACMSDLSNYLAVACTALVIRMLDDGACVGPLYKLADPVGALRILDADSTWSAPLPLASGGAAAAIDIQEHYLRAAEAYVRKVHCGWMPAAVRRWRWAVDRLRAQGPAGLTRELDPYIKLRLYASLLARKGMPLAEFTKWCGPVDMAGELLAGTGTQKVRDLKGYLHERMPSVPFEFLRERMGRGRLDWADLPVAAALYAQMLAVDFEYHDIAPSGLYFRLRDAGVVNSRLVREADVVRAMRTPPTGTRAQVRGAAIREVASEKGAMANWLEVRAPGRRMSTADPRATEAQWEATGEKEG